VIIFIDKIIFVFLHKNKKIKAAIVIHTITALKIYAPGMSTKGLGSDKTKVVVRNPKFSVIRNTLTIARAEITNILEAKIRRIFSEKRKYKTKGQNKKIPAPCCNVRSINGNGVVLEPTNENSSTEDAIREEGMIPPCNKKSIIQENI
jgi:hypothetical protein